MIDLLSQLEDALKALGQSTRLKIIFLLAVREHCVCELERILGISQPAVSQQMKSLKSVGFVQERREGQWIFYSLEREAVKSVLSLMATALDQPRETMTLMEAEWQRQDDLLINPLIPCRPCGDK